MRLHTNLDSMTVRHALEMAKKAGHVTRDVCFMDGLAAYGSHSRQRAFEVRLGTHEKDTLPAGYIDQNGHKMTVRRYSNSGDGGAASDWVTGGCAVYSATWHEWGWFMANVFAADPDAIFGSKSWGYHGADDFHAKTENKFRETA